MKKLQYKPAVFVISLFWAMFAFAESNTPWGTASTQDINYAPNKVVYDVAVSSVETLNQVLDRLVKG